MAKSNASTVEEVLGSITREVMKEKENEEKRRKKEKERQERVRKFQKRLDQPLFKARKVKGKKLRVSVKQGTRGLLELI